MRVNGAFASTGPVTFRHPGRTQTIVYGQFPAFARKVRRVGTPDLKRRLGKAVRRLRLKAELSQEAKAMLEDPDGRCEMCGRTVARHLVCLAVDHKIPLASGGGSNSDNLWIICSDCKTGRDLCMCSGQRLDVWIAAKGVSAIERIISLAVRSEGKAIPRSVLKAAAQTSDWPRSVRQLRKLGWTVIFTPKLEQNGRREGAYTFHRKLQDD